MKKLVLLPLLVFLIAACNGSPTPVPETPLLPSLATDTPAAPDSTPTPAPTNTISPTLAPTATLTPTPSPTITPLFGVSTTVRTQAHLRAGPGEAFAIVGEIGPDQSVIVVARTPAGDWVQLNMEGDGQIWMATSLLDLPADAGLPIASDIPTAPPTPTPGDIVQLGESSITLPTYPWQNFTSEAFDPTTAWSYQRFDRAAYEASNPQPNPQTYALLSLENRWLKLTLMPELGGRLYQMVFKPTGSNELYQNAVVKPSPWGPPEQGGWLAAGGIEWALPVIEHGYAWAEPWGFITQPGDDEAAITLFDQGQDRPHLSVDVGMQADSAAFTLDFLLENLSTETIPISYWTNAMLAPGPANSVGPDLRFLFPGDQAMVHSTGATDLPAEQGVFAWPRHNGRDVSALGTWDRWLGFFIYPQAQANWAAVYDTAADEGVVRIFPRRAAPGLKGFGFGGSEPIDPNSYTDDGSSYVEMQGGIAPTYWDSVPFAPDQSLSWRETWYPVAGIGGVSQADADGAAHLERAGDGLRLRIFSTRSRSGELIARDARGEVLRTALNIDPAHPADIALPAAQAPISFELRSADGAPWGMDGLAPDEGDG